MVGKKVPPRSAATELAGLLDSPEIERLIAELEETRWTGRPGYPIRAMVRMALAKSLYSIPTRTKTSRPRERARGGSSSRRSGAPAE